MPETFKTKYPSTRCILHCTKLFRQTPSSLFPQSSLYSSHKYHATFIGFFAIAPSWAKNLWKDFKQAVFHKKTFIWKILFWAKILKKPRIQLWKIADSQLRKNLSHLIWNWIFLYSYLAEVSFWKMEW